MMHIHRSLHPRSSIPRIYLSRHRGGRGLLNLEYMHSRMVLCLALKILGSSDSLVCLVRNHEMDEAGAYIIKSAHRTTENLGFQFETIRGRGRGVNIQLITELQLDRSGAQIKAAEQRKLFEQHVNRPMHGVFYGNIDELGLSFRLTFSYLRSAGFTSETEGFITTCQDGVINTLVYHNRVLRVQVPDVNCRACHRAPETLSTIYRHVGRKLSQHISTDIMRPCGCYITISGTRMR